MFVSLQNNTLSRADLSTEQGIAKNIHYGDILVNYGEVLNVNIEKLTMIDNESVIIKYKSSFLQNGDIIMADTAEDETVGKCTEIDGLKNQIVVSGLHTIPYRPQIKFASKYLGYYMNSSAYHNQLLPLMQGIKVTSISKTAMQNTDIIYPKTKEEQSKIGEFFYNIDNLITLHQQKNMKGKNIMKNLLRKSELFYEYYEKWISVYKVGAIRDVTMKKYKLTLNWLKKLVPTLEIKDLTRITYQQLLNDYAECHEKQSTMDFHHQLKGAILDAVDEGIIIRDPTRKAIIKGKIPKEKKIKYLNQFELQKLIADLDLGTKINYDWLILLIAKTGMRFSEALAITPKDFDFPHQMLTINKTWDYKGNGGFLPTKNTSSNRKVQLDWQTAIQFSELIKELDEDEPIFFTEKIYNSTINDILERHCKNVSVPIISIHGLRHTHASILLFAGVSIASVAHRLGHSSMTTTQKTYLHIIQELENTDIDLIMRSLTALNR